MEWHMIGDEETLKKKHCTHLFCKAGDDEDVVLIYHDNTFKAMENTCSHMGGPLSDGDIEDYKGKPHIMCPWHGYMFDIKTGKNEIGIRQEVFETKVEDGIVYVKHRHELSLQKFL